MHKRKCTMQIFVYEYGHVERVLAYVWHSAAFCSLDDERSFEFLGQYANQLLKVQLQKQFVMGTMMHIITFPKCHNGSSFEIQFRRPADSGRPWSVNTVHIGKKIFTFQWTTCGFKRLKLVKSLSILQQLWNKKKSMQKQLPGSKPN